LNKIKSDDASVQLWLGCARARYDAFDIRPHFKSGDSFLTRRDLLPNRLLLAVFGQEIRRNLRKNRGVVVATRCLLVPIAQTFPVAALSRLYNNTDAGT
jgi:hypothetical protein